MYYARHEQAYRQLLEQGQTCWDRRPFDEFSLRPFLEVILARVRPGQGARVLVLGCGTGPECCDLARRGFDVTGIDISVAAIEMAQHLAIERGLHIRYTTGDVCEALPEGPFDLILDAHCLHCLVFPPERAALLSHVRSALGPRGMLAVETMSMSEGMVFDPRFHLDGQGRLFVRCPADLPEAVRIGDEPYLPERYVTPGARSLIAEIEAARLRVIWHEDLPPEKTGEPGTIRVLACPAVD